MEEKEVVKEENTKVTVSLPLKLIGLICSGAALFLLVFLRVIAAFLMNSGKGIFVLTGVVSLFTFTFAIAGVVFGYLNSKNKMSVELILSLFVLALAFMPILAFMF